MSRDQYAVDHNPNHLPQNGRLFPASWETTALRWCLKTRNTRWTSRVRSSASSTPSSPRSDKRGRRSFVYWLSRLLLPNRWSWTWLLVISYFPHRYVDYVDSEYLIHNFSFITSLSRQLMMRRSPRGEPAPRRRARMTTKVGWRRWGSSGGCWGRRAETDGGRRGRKQIATLSCWRVNRMNKRQPQTWPRARKRVSLSFIRSEPGRSSEVLTTWHASRDCRSMFLEMF